MTLQPTGEEEKSGSRHFTRGLGLFDSSMIVIGIMVGSGIFIVPAEMARLIASPGWLLVAWVVTGVLTVTAGLTYGELAAMMPEAGGMYVYLREAFSPLVGFLYGWTLWTVIQTGTIAAVAIAFARFAGVLMPSIADSHYLIPPVHVFGNYFLSLSTTQLLAIGIVVLLSFANSLGLNYGRILQNIFTVAKIGALLALVALGCTIGIHHAAVMENFHHFWSVRHPVSFARGMDASTALGMFLAICIAQSGSLFAADAWHDITFVAAEVKNPARNLPLGAWRWNFVGDRAVPAGKCRLSMHASIECDSTCACRSRGDRSLAEYLSLCGSGADGHRHHGFNLRNRECDDAGRSAGVLRDGA